MPTTTRNLPQLLLTLVLLAGGIAAQPSGWTPYQSISCNPDVIASQSS